MNKFIIIGSFLAAISLSQQLMAETIIQLEQPSPSLTKQAELLTALDEWNQSLDKLEQVDLSVLQDRRLYKHSPDVYHTAIKKADQKADIILSAAKNYQRIKVIFQAVKRRLHRQQIDDPLSEELSKTSRKSYSKNIEGIQQLLTLVRLNKRQQFERNFLILAAELARPHLENQYLVKVASYKLEIELRSQAQTLKGFKHSIEREIERLKGIFLTMG